MITMLGDWPVYARLSLAFIVALVAFPAAGMAASAVRNSARKSSKLELLDTTVVTFGAELARIGFLTAALILVLTLAGVQSTSVAAVLGAVTLAIGLALQGTLANVAAGVLIFIFAPYRVGEFVEIGTKQGQVKLLSLFTTELESAQGLLYVVANSLVMAQPITNFTRNPDRRIDVDITLDWNTDTRIAMQAALGAMSKDMQLNDARPPVAIIKTLTDKGPVLSLQFWTSSHHSAELSFQAAAKVHAALQSAGIKSANASA